MDTDVDSDTADEREQVRPGSRVGRYLLLDRLGSGGMGWVFLAYDPELGRKVAIKVLRPDRRMGPLRSARLLREAQAMARLAHPNVVAIHDVGVWNEQVFVTMEYVQGRTLKAWLAQPRSPAQIVAVFLDAGRGLAAAHAAGLIHRDFKPDNVLVGEDGRARVMDFGLVRAYGDVEDAPDRELDVLDDREPTAGDSHAQRGLERASTASLSSPLTRVGALIGTPPYMAPEQFAGDEVDARTDQFAFCIALSEALWGQRPFAGGKNLAHDVLHDIRQPRPAGRRVPQWLDDIVERGLAHDPAARWPSMDMLLAALAVDPSLGRRRLVVAISVLLLTGVIAASLWAFGQHRHEQHVASCRAERESIQQIWSSERAATLELRFTQTGDPAASSSWEKTRQWLDAYAEELGRLRQHSCIARVEHTRTEAESVLVDACLDDHQANFEALVEVLIEARGGMIQHAANAAASLPLLASCTDTRRQAAVLRPPADLREQLRGSSKQLYRGEALRLIGEIEEARDLTEAALASAESLDWKPAVAHARLALAHLHLDMGEFEEAQRFAEQAFRKAAVAGDTVRMLDAALLIAHLENNRGQYAEADAWTETSAELIQGAGLESSLLAARLAVIRSRVARSGGRLADARAQAERGLQLYEVILGFDHPTLEAPLEALASALRELDEKKLAAAVTERELDILARAYGPDNIRLIKVYNSVGASLYLANEHDSAREYYMRGIAITERVFGPENPQLLAPLLNLGLIAYDRGDLEGARVHFEQSLKIHTAAIGENADTIKLLVNLGNTASRQGRHEQALAYFDRCVAILEAAQQDPFDMRETFVRASHADAYVRMGDLDAAYSRYERALAVVMALAGSDDPKLVRPLLGLAGIDIERGALDAAEAKLTQAAALIEHEPVRRWVLEFRRGQLLWARGEHQRARAQLRALRDQQASADPKPPYAAGEIDAWLASHTSP